MSSAHDEVNTSGSPGGRTAAGATPVGKRGGTPPSAGDPVDVPATPDLHDIEEAALQVEEEAEHRPPPAGPITNLVVATIVIAFGAAALVGAMSLGAGSAGNPGSGTWPLILSVTIIVLGLGLLLTARTTADTERFTHSTWQVVAGLATMVVFVAFIDVIGFEIPAGLLAFVWLRFLGGESWRMSVIASIGMVVAFLPHLRGGPVRPHPAPVLRRGR
ncbi:tripartite tricarboxylate transporter TctB family protein [Blastococcus goldschmidtiae]|uniref:Tripartite tricarboxylate transporter TctB family protein n=1 Tax=Blastococcus goldschmidtiae TaxID=3075546 RepID=A0ABU2KBK9_9ACTN|nr:tripartite tricarboxylate transporter TctB family protein [Blastococcus sp. DSM 46792]MDT0277557.1 tripartite tricarboxylate transporter TctB family protein [Blastococcus sp. DSM 46792]